MAVQAAHNTTINVFLKNESLKPATEIKLLSVVAESQDTDFVWVSKDSEQQQEPSSSSGSGETFNGHAFMRHVQSHAMGHVLLSTPEMTSTQEFMRQHASRLGGDVVLVADRQTSGKGRGGNQWTSPAGCLMFTCSRKLTLPGTRAPFINYVACLGVVQGIADAVKEAAPSLEKPLDIRIKWPNDIYAGALKIGGALIHTTAQPGGKFLVLTGIGLNVGNAQPTTCINQLLAAALQHQGVTAPPAVSRELVLAHIITRLEQCFDVLQDQGFEPLEPAYLASWLHSGQRVMALDPLLHPDQPGLPGPAGGPSSSPVPLTILGLSPSGYLLAADEQGCSYELTPDGNSLDMMQGLLKRKV
eukprot:CAMPEP_0202893470 /NCGR_PEP_ID=MMETSP1392-20130828/3052_1 /ASSEMBLY_ACC=CAM_ASM_000868 /TAXON_ID=225041 /ORGANISM="Chlamydomonas chlamydogama, Strain SAG 11-48b" /LENGTH=357 /DNA_ID=CAMNT_0049577817 /DNA_START=158 /DNA_END=1231 /DNA_ORIENTATION=-